MNIVTASTIAMDETCKEKVIKVFNLSLLIFNMFVGSQKVEQQQKSIETFTKLVTERNIIFKLL